MLSSIKDKLLNVTKTVPLFSNNSNNSDKEHVQCGVNLNAGSEILSHYQNEWEAIHKTNEANAKKAEEVADMITKLTNKIDRDKQSIGLMTHLLSNSNLQVNIVSCTKQVTQLYRGFNEVEEGLLQLEDLIENIQFEGMKKQHRYHLQQYKARKEETFKSFEATLKQNHEKAVHEFELKKKKELDEAIKSGLELFKKTGTFPKHNIPQKQPSALLEEIQIDYDEKELDQFFEDNPAE